MGIAAKIERSTELQPPASPSSRITITPRTPTSSTPSTPTAASTPPPPLTLSSDVKTDAETKSESKSKPSNEDSGDKGRPMTTASIFQRLNSLDDGDFNKDSNGDDKQSSESPVNDKKAKGDSDDKGTSKKSEGSLKHTRSKKTEKSKSKAEDDSKKRTQFKESPNKESNSEAAKEKNKVKEKDAEGKVIRRAESQKLSPKKQTSEIRPPTPKVEPRGDTKPDAKPSQAKSEEPKPNENGKKTRDKEAKSTSSESTEPSSFEAKADAMAAALEQKSGSPSPEKRTDGKPSDSPSKRSLPSRQNIFRGGSFESEFGSSRKGPMSAASPREIVNEENPDITEPVSAKTKSMRELWKQKELDAQKEREREKKLERKRSSVSESKLRSHVNAKSEPIFDLDNM